MTHRLNADATATDATGASPLPPDDRVNTAVNAFRMLADPTRVRILYALARQEHAVNDLAALIGTSPTAISQHLAKLRLAGLVSRRKQGTFVYYSLADTHVGLLIDEGLGHADHLADQATD